MNKYMHYVFVILLAVLLTGIGLQGAIAQETFDVECDSFEIDEWVAASREYVAVGLHAAAIYAIDCAIQLGYDAQGVIAGIYILAGHPNSQEVADELDIYGTDLDRCEVTASLMIEAALIYCFPLRGTYKLAAIYSIEALRAEGSFEDALTLAQQTMDIYDAEYDFFLWEQIARIHQTAGNYEDALLAANEMLVIADAQRENDPNEMLLRQALQYQGRAYFSLDMDDLAYLTYENVYELAGCEYTSLNTQIRAFGVRGDGNEGYQLAEQYCLTEYPELQALAYAYADEDFNAIGIAKQVINEAGGVHNLLDSSLATLRDVFGVVGYGAESERQSVIDEIGQRRAEFRKDPLQLLNNVRG
jgi:tetratricopeptide (TPR) repeat protein